MPRYIPDFKEAFDHFCLHVGGLPAFPASTWAVLPTSVRPTAQNSSVSVAAVDGCCCFDSLEAALVQWLLSSSRAAPSTYPASMHIAARAGGRGVVEGLSKQLGLNPRQMAPSANTLHW